MKVVRISMIGVEAAIAHIVDGKKGRFYAISHGQEGRGRWELRVPLASREFPVPTSPVQVAVVGHNTGSFGDIISVALSCGHNMFPKEAVVIGEKVICDKCYHQEINLSEIDLKLVDLKSEDARGNKRYLLAKGEADNTYLVLLGLSSGYRGSATYTVEGNAEIVGVGYVADGIAGRVGGADAPMIYVNGPCVISWSRSGRIYGTPRDWVARFDGERWEVSSVDECSIEDAALNY